MTPKAHDSRMTDEQRRKVEDCRVTGTWLTENEVAFIDDISMFDLPLSDEQARRLEAIWKRVT